MVASTPPFLGILTSITVTQGRKLDIFLNCFDAIGRSASTLTDVFENIPQQASRYFGIIDDHDRTASIQGSYGHSSILVTPTNRKYGLIPT